MSEDQNIQSKKILHLQPVSPQLPKLRDTATLFQKKSRNPQRLTKLTDLGIRNSLAISPLNRDSGSLTIKSNLE